MAAPAFVTESQAAWQIRESLTGMPAEKLAALQDTIARASGVVLDYLKEKGDPTWTPATAPEPVRQATLLYIAFAWRNVGDALGEGNKPAEALWEDLGRLLVRLRDPGYA